MKLEIHNSGRQKCTICKRYIPKHIQRISIEHIGRYGREKSIRICGLCILNFSKDLNIEGIKEWEKFIMVDEL